MHFDKLFNMISVIFGIVGGYLCQCLGGYDAPLKALVALITLDYVTGVIKAIYTKTLSSQIGFRGLLKKTVELIVVASSVIIQGIIGDSVPLREIVIMFFVCNDAISLLENAAEFVPIPEKLRETLIQLRERDVE